MNEIYLQLFPPGSLASSVTTTVWVGVFVSAMFNLRFGWALSGLVVPGYLVPLMLVKPWSAMVVVVEGAITYFIVLWVFTYLSNLGGWTSVFGRDRFFALLLVSVLTRLVMDGWVLPAVGEMVTGRFGIPFDYRNNLYSFGLIIVALIANQFWKPGFFKGLLPLFFNVGTTYLIVRYILMPYTNFSISNLAYLYEDIATTMLASPKSYIILLTTAFLASHMNLKYGWEFSGILIPSLIALLWYQPWKIVSSFFETFVILVVAALLLKLPVFKKTTIEGARKILLFFNISYVYKFLLAYLILWFMPDKKITDYYGFGYLLPSLLAIKMFDKDIAAKMTRTTLQTSLVAIVIASGIGFSLTFLPKPHADAVSIGKAGETIPVMHIPDTPLGEVLRKEKIRLYRGRSRIESLLPLPGEIGTFADSLGLLKDYAVKRDPETLAELQSMLGRVGYRVSILGDRLVVLSETAPFRDWGIYVMDLDRLNGKFLVVEIPAPLMEKGVMDAGVGLFQAMEAKALAVAGSRIIPDSSIPNPGSFNVPRSFFHAFHKEMGRHNVVQVWGQEPGAMRSKRSWRRRFSEKSFQPISDENRLWVKSQLPADLRIGELKKIIGPFSVQWGAPNFPNIQRNASVSGFAELFLNEQALRKLSLNRLGSSGKTAMDKSPAASLISMDGYPGEWLLEQKELICPRGCGKYVAPTLEELLFFDEEVLTPLLRAGARHYRNNQWSEAGLLELSAISENAAAVGYRLIRFRHQGEKREYLILSENEAMPDRKYRGTLVVDPGAGTDFMVEIPYPLSDMYVFEYGIELFRRLDCRLLFFSGAHRGANPDESADLLRFSNKRNLLNLARQVLFREFGDTPMMGIQVRAMGEDRELPVPQADAVLAFAADVENREDLSLLGETLAAFLDQDKRSFDFVDGSIETAGYGLGLSVPALSLSAASNKEYAILWLSAQTRKEHRQQSNDWWEIAQFTGLEIETQTGYILSYLDRPDIWVSDRQVTGELISSLKTYIDSGDIIVMNQILKRFPNLNFKRFVDSETRMTFLLAYGESEKLLLAANLAPLDLDGTARILAEKEMKTIVAKFIESRTAWLVKGSE